MMRRLLVASALAHVAIFVWLARSPARVPVAAPAAPMEELAVEIETPAAPLSPPAPEPTAESAGVGAVAPARVVGGAPSVVASAAPALSAEPIAGGNTDWVVNLGPGIGGPGTPGNYPGASNGVNPFLVHPPAGSAGSAQGPVAEGPPKRQDALANGLRSAFVAPDQVNGIVAPVTRTIEEETRLSLAPVRGNAVFRAIVDSTGAVTSLQMLESTGDRAGWNDARERALAALQQKKLNLRGANGAMIDIRVESELRYPSGATNRVDVTGPLSLSGDLSDLASKPQRVVRTRLSGYTPL